MFSFSTQEGFAMDEEMRLSVADLSELTGVNVRLLKDWARRGLLPCAVESGGTGHQRRWSLSEALGALVAARVWATPRGCCLDFIRIVTAGFGRKPLSHWRKQLIRKPAIMTALETGPGEPYTSHIVLDVMLPDRIDVRQALADLLAAVARMSARPGVGPEGGRKRGLAGTKKATSEV
jgi:hypothetical protein